MGSVSYVIIVEISNHNIEYKMKVTVSDGCSQTRKWKLEVFYTVSSINFYIQFSKEKDETKKKFFFSRKKIRDIIPYEHAKTLGFGSPCFISKEQPSFQRRRRAVRCIWMCASVIRICEYNASITDGYTVWCVPAPVHLCMESVLNACVIINGYYYGAFFFYLFTYLIFNT